jgi:hypothetical protein
VSFLWADAAAHQLAERTAAWYDDEHDQEHEQGEYSVRPAGEKIKARRNRYTSQVVDRHNVPRKAAFEAMMHVTRHLEGGSAGQNPTDYGFASATRFSRDHYDHEMTKKLMDPETWRHRPVEQVPTDEIHATQHFINPSSVAHNLFWPGHRQPVSDKETGDPDIEPEAEPHDIEDDDEYSSSDERELHRNAKFMTRHDGRIECVDGHHRAGADIILGKKTTPGQMIHERDLSPRPQDARRAIEDPGWTSGINDHVIREHGWDPGELAADRSHYGRQQLTHQHDQDHEWHGKELGHYHPDE